MSEIKLDKGKIKSILMSMKTTANASYVDELLEKIDKMDEKRIESILKDVGYTEEAVKKVLEGKILQMLNNTRSEEKFPINKLFTYGITSHSVHLHLPGNLFQITSEKSPSRAQDKVNLYLIDAIEKIKALKENGDARFQNVNNIYMISRLLSREDERTFLSSLGFETHVHRGEDLKNPEYIEKNPEALLAIHLFGSGKNVGSASMPIDKIYTKEWQDKKKILQKEFESKGIYLQQDEEIR